MAYMGWEGGNWTITDSCIRRKWKQNRYQLLKINLVMLLFQFQQMVFNEISRGFYETRRRKLDNVWFLYPKDRKAELISATQDKLGNTPFPILINWYGKRSRVAYIELDGRNWTMSDSYIQREGKHNRY